MSEFKIGNSQRRKDRRICPKCLRRCQGAERCAECNVKTRPRIEITWYVGGERKRELTDCHKPEEAREFLRQKEEDYWRTQRAGAATRQIGGRLDEAIKAYAAAMEHHSGNYKKQIRTALAALCNGLGEDCQVQTITRDVIIEFRDEGLKSGRSPTTVRSYLIVLRQFFNWLEAGGWIRQDPTYKLKFPAARARKDCLWPSEVRPVLEAFERIAPPIAPIAAAILLGGWRKGEIINLRHRDVDLADRWAYVLDFEGDELTEEWSPKTESSARAVPLHPIVADAIARVPRVHRASGQESPWVFPVVDERRTERRVDRLGRVQLAIGDRRSSQTTFIGDRLKVVLEAAGIDRKVTVHGLRRTFSMLLAEAGAPDAIIGQALGHSAKGVTQFNYLPRRDPLIKEWVDKIKVD